MSRRRSERESPAFGDYLRTVVESMVRQIPRVDARYLTVDVRVRPLPPGVFEAAGPGAATGFVIGWPVDNPAEDTVWVRVSVPDEAFDFAIGDDRMSPADLTRQLALLADELESWLSETTLGWGIRFDVPRSTVAEPRPWW